MNLLDGRIYFHMSHIVWNNISSVFAVNEKIGWLACHPCSSFVTITGRDCDRIASQRDKFSTMSEAKHRAVFLLNLVVPGEITYNVTYCDVTLVWDVNVFFASYCSCIEITLPASYDRRTLRLFLVLLAPTKVV
jgi:hypothetical protein